MSPASYLTAPPRVAAKSIAPQFSRSAETRLPQARGQTTAQQAPRWRVVGEKLRDRHGSQSPLIEARQDDVLQRPEGLAPVFVHQHDRPGADLAQNVGGDLVPFR